MSTIQQPHTNTTTRKVTLPIRGFGCGGGGALMVERAIARVPGVSRVYVNQATEMAYVEFDLAQCSRDDLVAAVTRAGFRVGVTNRL